MRSDSGLEVDEVPDLACGLAYGLAAEMLDDGGAKAFLMFEFHGVEYATVAIDSDKVVVVFRQFLELFT